MHKAAKEKHFIKQPVYVGGPAAMKKLIGENLHYPQEALENKIEGTVFVKYDIDYQGNVVDAKVITGLGHGCDDEAIRLVKLLKFKVEKTRGVRVLYHKNIQIHFRLPKEKTQTTTIQYNYTTPQKPAPTQEEEKKSEGYSYSIQF